MVSCPPTRTPSSPQGRATGSAQSHTVALVVGVVVPVQAIALAAELARDHGGGRASAAPCPFTVDVDSDGPAAMFDAINALVGAASSGARGGRGGGGGGGATANLLLSDDDDDDDDVGGGDARHHRAAGTVADAADGGVGNGEESDEEDAYVLL